MTDHTVDMTFSVVARSGETFGVAVASKFPAVGALVPAARVGVGAAATQAMARVADLRVDDHQQAPSELARLVEVDELVTGVPAEVLPFAGDATAEARVLEHLGAGPAQG